MNKKSSDQRHEEHIQNLQGTQSSLTAQNSTNTQSSTNLQNTQSSATSTNMHNLNNNTSGINNTTLESPLNISNDEKSVEDIIKFLRLISKIKKDQKINTAYFSIEDNTLWTKILRTLSFGAQSRKNSFDVIKDVFSDSLLVLEKCFSSNSQFHHSLGKKILENMDEAQKGVEEFKKTYSDDNFFISEIEGYQIVLCARLDELKRKYNR